MNKTLLVLIEVVLISILPYMIQGVLGIKITSDIMPQRLADALTCSMNMLAGVAITIIAIREDHHIHIP